MPRSGMSKSRVCLLDGPVKPAAICFESGLNNGIAPPSSVPRSKWVRTTLSSETSATLISTRLSVPAAISPDELAEMSRSWVEKSGTADLSECPSGRGPRFGRAQKRDSLRDPTHGVSSSSGEKPSDRDAAPPER